MLITVANDDSQSDWNVVAKVPQLENLEHLPCCKT